MIQAPVKKKTLKQMREETGRSIVGVAKIYGVTRHSISNWENGVRTPTITIIEDLLRIYGYTIDELDTSIYRNGVND